MSKKTAVLLDGGFVLRRLRAMLGGREPFASDILAFARKCLADDDQGSRCQADLAHGGIV